MDLENSFCQVLIVFHPQGVAKLLKFWPQFDLKIGCTLPLVPIVHVEKPNELVYGAIEATLSELDCRKIDIFFKRYSFTIGETKEADIFLIEYDNEGRSRNLLPTILTPELVVSKNFKEFRKVYGQI